VGTYIIKTNMWNNKLLQKLENSPQNVNYFEIETLFKNEHFKIIDWKWSHKRIIYKKDPKMFVSFALHENDCKVPYKKQLNRLYKFYLSDNNKENDN
jgi:hypothetical protein